MPDFTHNIIDPVTGNTIGTVTLTQDVEPTDTEWGAIDAGHVDSSRPRTIDQAKADAIARIESVYQSVFDAGITAGGITLAADSDWSSQNKLTGLAGLLREAEELGAITDSTSQTIIDAGGQPQTMTVAALRMLLVAYGFAVQTIFQNRATKLGQIAAATTIEAADAVTW